VGSGWCPRLMDSQSVVDESVAVATAGTPETASEVIRLAVVMNGGVSLAVWMGGVTHELHRLLDRGLGEDVSPAWRAILAAPSQQTDPQQPRRRQVVVDYVAGTSAGGLNGSLLATSIARRASLPGLKGLRLTSARLTQEALLLAPEDTGAALLDGPFFEREILRTLEEIKASTSTDGDEVTLIVTATAPLHPSRSRTRTSTRSRSATVAVSTSSKAPTGPSTAWTSSRTRCWLARRAPPPASRPPLDEVRRGAWNDARALARSQPKRARGRPPADAPPRPGSERAKALKGARYSLWKNPENLTENQRIKLAWIAATDPKLCRAYLLKEGLRLIFTMPHAARKPEAAAAQPE
jgi:hypothetical protein